MSRWLTTRAGPLSVGCLVSVCMLVGCSVGDGATETGGATTPARSPVAATATARPLPDVPVAQLEQALTSDDETLVLALVGAPEDADVDPEALSRITDLLAGAELDADGIELFGEDVVTIPAVVNGANWLFYFVVTDGEWKLALTEEIP